MQQPPGYNFGQQSTAIVNPLNTASSTGTSGGSGFSFGIANTSGPGTSGFSFVQPTTTSNANLLTGGGLFGPTSTSASNFSTSAPALGNTASSGFNFGTPTATTSPSTVLGLLTAQAPTTTNVGLFGQTSSSTTGGLFGQTSTTSATGAGLFGVPPSAAPISAPAGHFGQPAALTSAPAGVFGQPAPLTSAPVGLFAQPAAPTGLFGQPTAPVASTSGLFGQPTAPVASISGLFGQPTAPVASTSGLFGQPTAPFASLSAPTGLFAQPISSPKPGLLGAVTSTTTTGGLFSQPATGGLFPQTNSGTGLLGISNTTNLSLSSLTPATTPSIGLGGSLPTITPVAGLGGFQPLTMDSGTGNNAPKGDGKGAKEAPLPNDIFSTIAMFEIHKESEKNACEENVRQTAVRFHKLGEDTKKLRQHIVKLSNQHAQLHASARKLKSSVIQEAENVEMARRTQETPIALQGDNKAPEQFFLRLIRSFEERMTFCKNKIDELEKCSRTNGVGSEVTAEDMKTILKKEHDLIKALAAKVYTLHNQLLNHCNKLSSQMRPEALFKPQSHEQNDIGISHKNSSVLRPCVGDTESGLLHFQNGQQRAKALSLGASAPVVMALGQTSAPNLFGTGGTSSLFGTSNQSSGLNFSSTSSPGGLNFGLNFSSSPNSSGLNFGSSNTSSLNFGSDSGPSSPFGSQKPFGK